MAYTLIIDSSDLQSLAGLSARISALEVPKVFAQVELTADAILSSGDTFAQSGWVATTNIGSAFKTSATAGTGTGFARLVVPYTGRYELNWRMITNSGAGATRVAIKVTKNGRTINTQSIATDAGKNTGEGNDFHNHIWLNDRFTAGDILYWATYSDNAYALSKATFTGAKTNLQFKWMGDY